MLEWYKTFCDEWELNRECNDLLIEISFEEYAVNRVTPDSTTRIIYLEDEMEKKAGCNFKRSSLEDAVIRHGLTGKGENPSELRYEELFFTLFLNLVEPNLGHDGPVFVHGYPPELSANSIVENGVARRFEMYWKGIELANGYYEITDYDAQINQFQRDNTERVQVGKNPVTIDPQLEKAMKSGLPICSGIALGIDRLLMILLDETKLSRVSPFTPAPGSET
jgi:lysyl-tRNA synthetase class 2